MENDDLFFADLPPMKLTGICELCGMKLYVGDIKGVTQTSWGHACPEMKS